MKFWVHEEKIYGAFDVAGRHVIDSCVLGLRRWVVCDAEGTPRPVLGISVADALAVNSLYQDVRTRNVAPASVKVLVGGISIYNSTVRNLRLDFVCWRRPTRTVVFRPRLLWLR